MYADPSFRYPLILGVKVESPAPRTLYTSESFETLSTECFDMSTCSTRKEIPCWQPTQVEYINCSSRPEPLTVDIRVSILKSFAVEYLSTSESANLERRKENQAKDKGKCREIPEDEAFATQSLCA